jgi:phage terminase small subunit
MALTSQQSRFLEALLGDPKRNAKRAALAAGCTEKSAKCLGSRWKNLPEVQAALVREESAKRSTEKSTGKGRKSTGKEPKMSTAKRSTGKAEKFTVEGMPLCVVPPPGSPTGGGEPLSERHLRWCSEFIIDDNATQAYLRSYPKSSYESARRSAHELMTNPDILAHVQELRAERNRRLGISADRVLSGLARLAFYDPRDLFDADWRLKPFDELSPDAAFVVSGFTTKATVTGEEDDGICVTSNIRLPDKTRALELLGRNLKLFTDRIEISEDATFTDRFKTLREQEKEQRLAERRLSLVPKDPDRGAA